jgi:hypothetical protein
VPWDWDGQVPRWLLEALDVIATFYPEAQTWLEILEKVDEYAPTLLEGLTPPDPYIKFTDSTDNDAREYKRSGYVDDTTEPTWRSAFIDVERFERAGFVVVEVWDSDIAFDDFMGQFVITVEDLSFIPTDGEWILLDVPTLFEVEVSVY